MDRQANFLMLQLRGTAQQFSAAIAAAGLARIRPRHKSSTSECRQQPRVRYSNRTPDQKMAALQRLREHAAAKGGHCLADVYLNCVMPVLWECSHGHTWRATPQNVLRGGSWCPQCAATRRRGSLQRCAEHAETRGGKCLSTVYSKSRDKLLWQCKLRHAWQASAEQVLNHNSWCPECSRRNQRSTKHNLKSLKDYAASLGGDCLAIDYHGVARKVAWLCEKGHTWHASPSQVLNQKSWCPFCAGRAPIGLERLQRHAFSRGGKCLAQHYTNNTAKVVWKCEFGHEWQARVHNVLTKGQWCPECRRIGLPTLRTHAALRGGKCLAESYKNSRAKLLWECQAGHRWEATASSIVHQKSWCPHCAIGNWKSEAETRSIFENIFRPSKFPSSFPTFLGGLQLDGFCPELSLAFEYQGEQHYDPGNYFHFGDPVSFQSQQERDARKSTLCQEAGVRLVLVPHFVNDKRMFVVTALLRWFSIHEITPTAITA